MAAVNATEVSLSLWHRDFNANRSIRIDLENCSYLQAESENNSIDDEDIMSVLSRGYELEFNRWAYRMEPLQKLCKGLKPGTLASSILSRGAEVALVLDRDCCGQRPPGSGSLTLDGLHEVLRTPRFDVATVPCAIQADQRIIYLTDPDRYSFAVLAATVPVPQALPLFEFMADRLSSEPRFSIRVPPKGFAVFNMIFHLPFVVFRTASSVDDVKGPIEGRPNYTNLSFLNFDSTSNNESPNRSESHFLCEAVFSCFIHGWDYTRWTAYGLFDTYFDKPECRESTEHYCNDALQSEPEFAGDPLTLAHEDLNTPVSCPRHYFLRILLHRVIRVRDEWGKVIFEVLEMMKVGQEQCQAVFQTFRPDTADDDLLLKAIEAWQDKLNQVNQLNIKTRSLLITLKRRLEKMVDAWQMFASKDAKYLYQPGSLVNVGDDAIQTLHSIDRWFSELGCLRDELRHQVEIFEKDCMQEYEQHNRDLHTFLAGQAERTAQAQQRTAQAQQRIAQAQQAMSEDLRALTWVSFLFLPVLVAAALCSTQTGPEGVVYATLTTFVLAALAFDALTNWRWCSWMLSWFRSKLAARHEASRARDGQPILPINHPTTTSTATSMAQSSVENPAPQSNTGGRATADNRSSPNEMGGTTLRQRS